MNALKIEIGKYRIEPEDCRTSARIVGALVFLCGLFVMWTYNITPFEMEQTYYRPQQGELRTTQICNDWEIEDAVGVAKGCRQVVVLRPGQDVWVHRPTTWYWSCRLTVDPSWEPGPGNPAKGHKLMSATIQPKPIGRLDKPRPDKIPILTAGHWGYVARDTAACSPFFWQFWYPIKMPTMITEFVVEADRVNGGD